MKKCISGSDHLSLLHCSLEIFVLDSVGLRHILAPEAIAPLLVILPLEPEVETNLRKDFTITVKAPTWAFSLVVKLQTSRRFVSSSTLSRSFLSLLVGEVAGLAVNQGGETIMGSCSVSTVSRAGDIWGEETFDFEI